jgi:hypothetical protein
MRLTTGPGGGSAAVCWRPAQSYKEGELLACWTVSGEHPDRRIEYLEPMGGAHGNVDEVALGERERAVIDVEDGIALEHVPIRSWGR